MDGILDDGRKGRTGHNPFTPLIDSRGGGCGTIGTSSVAKAMASTEMREPYVSAGGDTTVRGAEAIAALIREPLPKRAKLVSGPGVRID